MHLLERETEQEALSALVHACCAGVGRLAVVEGAAGIGKAALLAAARVEAERAGMAVFSARGSELEREFAYGVVRQLFDPVVAPGSETERAELFAGAAGQAVELFDPRGPTEDTGGEGSFALLHGLFWMLANLCAHAPVLMCVDDVRFCDLPSFRFLAYVLSRLEALPVLMLVSLRPIGPG